MGWRNAYDGGAKARFYHAVADAHMTSIIRVDMESDLFSYELDGKVLARARLMDGKLLLVTNVLDMTPAEVVKRYKSLADLERGFFTSGCRTESAHTPRSASSP